MNYPFRIHRLRFRKTGMRKIAHQIFSMRSIRTNHTFEFSIHNGTIRQKSVGRKLPQHYAMHETSRALRIMLALSLIVLNFYIKRNLPAIRFTFHQEVLWVLSFLNNLNIFLILPPFDYN